MCYTVKRRDLVENVQLVRNALESSWFPSFPSSPFHSVPLSGLTALGFSFFLPSCCVVSPPPRFLSLPLSVLSTLCPKTRRWPRDLGRIGIRKRNYFGRDGDVERSTYLPMYEPSSFLVILGGGLRKITCVLTRFTTRVKRRQREDVPSVAGALHGRTMNYVRSERLIDVSASTLFRGVKGWRRVLFKGRTCMLQVKVAEVRIRRWLHVGEMYQRG